MKFKKMLKRQREFSNLFFDADQFNDDKREEMTKSFALALHGEVSALVSSINFKDHHANRKTPDREKILYESIDALRYLLAIMNTWGYTPDEVDDAFNDKDTFLHMRHKSETAKWDGRPVLIVDVDDVIAHFRKDYFKWLEATYDIVIPQDYPEYYASTPLKEKGINPEATFKDFISDRKLREIEPIDDTIDVLGRAQKMGYWIQLLTARPDQNLICLYDTYHWINQMNIPFDGLAFSGEKYRWVVQSPFYGHVAACIDDSPKHAAEYATHGLLVLSPELSYNTSLKDVKNVIHYSNSKQLLTELTNIIKDNKNNATES
jgi:hypothetical protein